MVALHCEIMKDQAPMLLCHPQGIISISVIPQASRLCPNHNPTEGARKGRVCLFPLSQNLSVSSLLAF